MKKILFSLIALMAVMTIQAQTIYGTWQGMKPEVLKVENGDGLISAKYTFKQDGTVVSNVDITYADKSEPKKDREMALKGSVKGTYTLKGNKLSMFFNANSLNLEITKISQNGVELELPAGAITTLNEKINNEVKIKAADLMKDQIYTVKFDANGSMLELTDTKDGETDRYMRMK